MKTSETCLVLDMAPLSEVMAPLSLWGQGVGAAGFRKVHQEGVRQRDFNNQHSKQGLNFLRVPVLPTPFLSLASEGASRGLCVGLMLGSTAAKCQVAASLVDVFGMSCSP